MAFGIRDIKTKEMIPESNYTFYGQFDIINTKNRFMLTPCITFNLRKSEIDADEEMADFKCLNGTAGNIIEMEALAVDFRPCTIAGHPFECKKKSKISAWMKRNEVVLLTRTVSFAPETKQKIIRVTKK